MNNPINGYLFQNQEGLFLNSSHEWKTRRREDAWFFTLQETDEIIEMIVAGTWDVEVPRWAYPSTFDARRNVPVIWSGTKKNFIDIIASK